VNVVTPSILNIEELLNRVDHDQELLVELFFIFKSLLPAHLQRLSQAVTNEEPELVKKESHTLKGMLLNLSAARAAAAAGELERMGHENKISGMKEILTGLKAETDLLLLQMDESLPELQS
jgi:HPt (histidine-containing phosphotransfer) domain-containing protein